MAIADEELTVVRFSSRESAMPEDEEQTHPSESEEQYTSSGGIVKTVVIGVLGTIAGAVAAVLLTPWRGAEARRKLKDGAAAARSAATKKAAALRGRDEGEEDEHS